MKKTLFILILLCAAAAASASSADEQYTVKNIIADIQKAGAPYVVGDYIVFTAEKNPRHVGIAFDFEDFRTIHSFERLVTHDYDYKPVDSVLFYVLKKPENTSGIQYRLIIDGLWTNDPLNPEILYNPKTNRSFSAVSYPLVKKTTTQTDFSSVRFMYQGEPGQKIRVAGTFSNWDSFIYVLEERSAGTYELSIPLPPGTYYYNFYTGISSFIDAKNPDRAYTPEGRIASVLTVQ